MIVGKLWDGACAWDPRSSQPEMADGPEIYKLKQARTSAKGAENQRPDGNLAVQVSDSIETIKRDTQFTSDVE